MNPRSPIRFEFRKLADLRDHEAAVVVPMMTPEERADLLADVKAHGIMNALDILPDGRILDGRNRKDVGLEACKERAHARVLDLSEYEAVEHIKRTAVCHRHLDPGQLAAIVVALGDKVKRLRAEAKKRQGRAGQAKGQKAP